MEGENRPKACVNIKRGSDKGERRGGGGRGVKRGTAGREPEGQVEGSCQFLSPPSSKGHSVLVKGEGQVSGRGERGRQGEDGSGDEGVRVRVSVELVSS